MKIKLNGDYIEIAEAVVTVALLLQQLEISKDRIAVELNGDIIQKADYEKKPISDGDCIEIVHFVGGGR